MKNLFLSILLVFMAGPSFAKLSETEQMHIVKNIARELRHNLWQQGHLEVDSHEFLAKKEILDARLASQYNDYTEEPLDRDQIKRIYQCFHVKFCSLYMIDVWSEYMAGYGTETAFVMIHKYTGKYSFIHHYDYAE